MNFWDTSAIVPLLVPEIQSVECTERLRLDSAMVVWALAPVEALSAIYRRQRRHRLSDAVSRRALRRLESLRAAWSEVLDVELVRPRAERLLSIHDLRAADALQLAAALIACDERPAKLPFVCLDARLGDAARREGFPLLP